MTEPLQTMIVDFGGGAVAAGGLIVVEADDDKNIGLDGEIKTTFYPGDDFYFTVHHDPSVTIEGVKPTSGGVHDLGGGTRTKETEITFALANEDYTLQCVPSSGISANFYGNSVFGLSVSDRELSATGGSFPAVADISYPYRVTQYRLDTPVMELTEEEDWPIKIVVYYRINE